MLVSLLWTAQSLTAKDIVDSTRPIGMTPAETLNILPSHLPADPAAASNGRQLLLLPAVAHHLLVLRASAAALQLLLCTHGALGIHCAA